MVEDAARQDLDVAAELNTTLHDMCQPLTALLCVLELAQMEAADHPVSDSVAAALRESERLRNAVIHMRKILESARRQQQTKGHDGTSSWH